MELDNPIYMRERVNGFQRKKGVFLQPAPVKNAGQEQHEEGEERNPWEVIGVTNSSESLMLSWNISKWLKKTLSSVFYRLMGYLFAWNVFERSEEPQGDSNGGASQRALELQFDGGQHSQKQTELLNNGSETVAESKLAISENLEQSRGADAPAHAHASSSHRIAALLNASVSELEEEDEDVERGQYGTVLDLTKRIPELDNDVLLLDGPASSTFAMEEPTRSTQRTVSPLGSNSAEAEYIAQIAYKTHSHAPPAKGDGASGIFDSLLTSPSVYNAAVARFYLPRIPISTPQYSLVDSLIASLQSQEKDKEHHWLDQKQELVKKERTAVKASSIRALSADQQHKVTKVWTSRNASMVVSSLFQIDISIRDMQTLCDGQWLNDNVIDFYLNLLASKKPDSLFCWTTHFFTTLQAKGYSGVARWAKRKKVNLTEKDLVVVPINIMGTHWALAVVDNGRKSFQYYDSLSLLGNMKALHILREYMVQEGKRVGSSIDFGKYDVEPLMDSPQQQNGYDCGVFTCTAAYYVSHSLPLSFSQKDMKALRRKMAYEILAKELLV